jgi:Ca2+-binding RTX toxin-like protein
VLWGDWDPAKGVAGTGNDRLYGEAGNDSLHGGAGTDTLSGGIGSDLFAFEEATFGSDVIVDFNSAAGDKIRFDTDIAKDFDTVRSVMRQVGLDTLIDFGNGNSIKLLNVGLAALSASDFQFM